MPIRFPEITLFCGVETDCDTPLTMMPFVVFAAMKLFVTLSLIEPLLN